MVEEFSDSIGRIGRDARHVAASGTLLVGPWLTPDRVREGGARDRVTGEWADELPGLGMGRGLPVGRRPEA